MRTVTSPRPAAGPPAPPTWLGRGGGGGEPFRVPWWLWVLAFGLAGCWLILVYELARVALGRPLPITAGLAGAVLVVWRHRLAFESGTARVQGLPYLGGIVGGILGELAHSLLVGAPPAVAHHVGWLAVGAMGIGGAIGVGVTMVVVMGFAEARLLFLLSRHWRRRRGPT